MTVDEILEELDDHGFVDTSTGRKLSKLNQLYLAVCARKAWPFLETSIQLTFDGTDPEATNSPTDIRTVSGVHLVAESPGLSHRRLADIRYKDETLVGDPIHFYFVGNSLRFWPIPPNGYTGTLDYIKRPAELVSGGSEASIAIPAAYHGMLVDGSLYKLYIMEDDPELAVFFRDEFRERLVELYTEFERQIVTPDVVQMVDPEDYDYYNVELY
jgi:hypothetical protein